MSSKIIEKKINTIEKELASLRRSLLNEKSKTLVICRACNTENPLSSWTYILKWHLDNFGGMRGEEWCLYAPKYNDIRCPNCNKIAYIYNHKQCDEIETIIRNYNYRSIFSNIEETR